MFENLELSLAGDKSFWKTLVARLTPDAARSDRQGARHHRRSPSERAALARTLSHGQKQWLEIGMLLMQEPELLLVDEPVAGMTPQETERTAELLLSLAGEHSIIVVEHDMDFVRSIATPGHRAARRPRAVGRRHGSRAERPPRHRGVPRSMSVLTLKAPQPVLRRQPHAVGRRPRRARRDRAPA